MKRQILATSQDWTQRVKILNLVSSAEGVVVSRNVGHDGFLIRLGCHHNLLGVQHLGNVQVLLSNLECCVQVRQRIILVSSMRARGWWGTASGLLWVEADSGVVVDVVWFTV